MYLWFYAGRIAWTFFFAQVIVGMNCDITVINAQWPGPFLWHIIDFLKIFELVRFLDLHNKQKKCKFRKLNIFWWNDSMTGHYFLLHRYSIGMNLELSLYYWKTEYLRVIIILAEITMPFLWYMVMIFLILRKETFLRIGTQSFFSLLVGLQSIS